MKRKSKKNSISVKYYKPAQGLEGAEIVTETYDLPANITISEIIINLREPIHCKAISYPVSNEFSKVIFGASDGVLRIR